MRREIANAVGKLAAREHRVLSTDELYGLGLDSAALARAVKSGRLYRKHRGVYAVGHPSLSREGRWLAAVKACGPAAAVSHHDAAYLARMLSPPAKNHPVHVIVPGIGGRGPRDGIIVHRSTTLTPADIMVRNGIPTTKPARTLADLKPILPREQWEAALDRARFLHLPFGDLASRDPARSHLERAFTALCRRHRLPLPEVNVWVGPYRVDFLWREQRLVVETDGWENHRDRASFEADRVRDAELKLMGYDVVRFTYRQVLEEPERVARTLRALLARPLGELRASASSPSLDRPRLPPGPPRDQRTGGSRRSARRGS